jgi:acyl carrier protein
MDDAQIHLVKCFSAVFPTLSPSEMLQASTTTVRVWDSVASVTLFAMIEEEYGIEIDMNELTEMTSFERILAYLLKIEAGKE